MNLYTTGPAKFMCCYKLCLDFLGVLNGWIFVFHNVDRHVSFICHSKLNRQNKVIVDFDTCIIELKLSAFYSMRKLFCLPIRRFKSNSDRLVFTTFIHQ